MSTSRLERRVSMPSSAVSPIRSKDVGVVGFSKTDVEEDEKVSSASDAARSGIGGEETPVVKNSTSVGTKRRLSRKQSVDPELDLDL